MRDLFFCTGPQHRKSPQIIHSRSRILQHNRAIIGHPALSEPRDSSRRHGVFGLYFACSCRNRYISPSSILAHDAKKQVLAIGGYAGRADLGLFRKSHRSTSGDGHFENRRLPAGRLSSVINRHSRRRACRIGLAVSIGELYRRAGLQIEFPEMLHTQRIGGIHNGLSVVTRGGGTVKASVKRQLTHILPVYVRDEKIPIFRAIPGVDDPIIRKNGESVPSVPVSGCYLCGRVGRFGGCGPKSGGVSHFVATINLPSADTDADRYSNKSFDRRRRSPPG